MRITNLMHSLSDQTTESRPVFDQVVESLKQHGTSVSVHTDEDGETCDFECGLRYWIRRDKGDPRWLSILAPCIFEITPSNELCALRAIVKVSSRYKLLKFARIESDVHICIDQYVGDNDSIEETLGRAFHIAEESFKEFHKEMENQNNTKPVKVVGFH